MKKLLSLLSVLTISGTAVPTTIAASPYQKEEKLNRQKRQNNKTIEQQKIVIGTNGWVVSSGVVFNNKLYFGSLDNNVYEYDSATGQQKIVIRTNDSVVSLGVVFNNKLYFGSLYNNVYEYSILYNLKNFIKKTNLNKIDNSSDLTILNELNYLNPNLDISQLKVTNKKIHQL